MHPLKQHTIPAPSLLRITRQNPVLAASSWCKRRPHDSLIGHARCKHSRATTHMVVVGVAQHHGVYMVASCHEVRHDHSAPRIKTIGITWPSIKQQSVCMGAHQDGTALANVKGQQLECPKPRPGRCVQHGNDTHKRQMRPPYWAPWLGQRKDNCTDHNSQPHGQRRRLNHSPRQLLRPLQSYKQVVDNWHHSAPSDAEQQAQHAQGQHHKTDQRDSQQINRHTHDRHLTKQQPRQRRKHHAQAPLHTPHADELSAHATKPCRGNLAWLTHDTQQHGNRYKTQPEPSTENCPRVPRHHNGKHPQPHHWPRPMRAQDL